MIASTQVWSRLPIFCLGSLLSTAPPKILAAGFLTKPQTRIPTFSRVVSSSYTHAHVNHCCSLSPVSPLVFLAKILQACLECTVLWVSWFSPTLPFIGICDKCKRNLLDHLLFSPHRGTFLHFPSLLFNGPCLSPTPLHDGHSGPSPIAFCLSWSSVSMIKLSHGFLLEESCILIPSRSLPNSVLGDGCFWGPAYMSNWSSNEKAFGKPGSLPLYWSAIQKQLGKALDNSGKTESYLGSACQAKEMGYWEQPSIKYPQRRKQWLGKGVGAYSNHSHPPQMWCRESRISSSNWNGRAGFHPQSGSRVVERMWWAM